VADFLPPAVMRFVTDTAEAVAGLTRLATSFEETGAAAKASSREMSAAVTAAGDKVAAESRAVTAENDRIIRSFQATATSAERANEKIYVSMEAMKAKSVKALADLEAAEARAAASTEALGDAMAGSADKAAVSGVGALKKVAAGTVLAAGLVAGVSVKMAGDFEQSTTRLETSAGESAQGLEVVRSGILSMAGEVGVSAGEMSTAMYKIESAGYHAEAGLGVLRAAEEGAKAEGAEGAKVADALSSALRDYYPHASSAAEVTKDASDTMSKFISATSQGKMTFDDLAGSLNSILPVASAAKISMSDVLGVLASMTVHGISAQQATQNMADAIRHLQAPTQVMSKNMAALGIDSTDVAAKLGQRGLSGTMEYLSQAVKKAMPPGSDKVILDLGNALSKSTPKVQELGKELMAGSITMKQFTGAAGKLDPISAGQAQSFATLAKSMHQLGTEQLSGEQVMTTYGGEMQKVMGDATGLKVALMTTGENADYTNDAIKAISGSTADAAGHVKGWAEVQGTFNQKLAQAKDGTEALAIRIGGYLLPVASRIAGVFADGAHWLASHDAAARALAIGVGVILAGALTAGVAKAISWVSNLDGMTGKIMGVTAKVGLMTAAFTYGANNLDDWSGKAALVVGGLTAISTMADIVKGPLKAVGDGFSNAKSSFKNFVSDVGSTEGAMGKITTTGKGVLNFLTGPWGIAIGLAVGAIALFTSGSDDASKAQDDLTKAIRDDNNALGENTRVWTVNRLEKDGALSTAKDLGLAEKDVTDALMNQGPALDNLKAKLNGIIKAGADTQNMGDQVTGAIDPTSNVAGAQKLLTELNNVSGALNASHDAALRQSSALHQSAGELNTNALAAISNEGSTKDLAGASQKAADAMEAQKNEAKLLTDQLDLLNGGNINATQAQIRFADSSDAATKSLKDNGLSLNLAEGAGRKNTSAIIDAVQAARDHASAVADQTHSVEAGDQAFRNDINTLQGLLAKAGLTKDQIADLAKQFWNFPPDIHRTVTVDTSHAFSALSSLVNVASTFNKLKGLKTGGLVGHYAEGGQIQHFPGGGLVHGGGSDTSDDVPIMASATEYVERGAAVRAAGVEVMDHLNNLNLKGAYSALGKRIGAGPDVVTVGGGGGGLVVNVTVGNLLSTKGEIKRAVQEAVLQNNLRNVQNGLSVTTT
jgi:TP901 family phage tail tape measure protein